MKLSSRDILLPGIDLGADECGLANPAHVVMAFGEYRDLIQAFRVEHSSQASKHETASVVQ
jgi:hypothetical protein